jgi:hypothetical protein
MSSPESLLPNPEHHERALQQVTRLLTTSFHGGRAAQLDPPSQFTSAQERQILGSLALRGIHPVLGSQGAGDHPLRACNKLDHWLYQIVRSG